MNEVVYASQVQGTDMPHSVHGRITKNKLSQQSQSKIDDAKSRQKFFAPDNDPEKPK